jgi:hypothetical protein
LPSILATRPHCTRAHHMEFSRARMRARIGFPATRVFRKDL